MSLEIKLSLEKWCRAAGITMKKKRIELLKKKNKRFSLKIIHRSTQTGTSTRKSRIKIKQTDDATKPTVEVCSIGEHRWLILIRIFHHSFALYFHEKIVLDEQIATNSEQINNDDGKNGSQYYGFCIAYDTLNDIPKRILTINNIEQLMTIDEHNITTQIDFVSY